MPNRVTVGPDGPDGIPSKAISTVKSGMVRTLLIPGVQETTVIFPVKGLTHWQVDVAAGSVTVSVEPLIRLAFAEFVM